MSKPINNSFLFGANCKRVLNATIQYAKIAKDKSTQAAVISAQYAAIKAEQAKLTLQASKAEFTKGFNSVK
jgi:hypothetical protein